MAAGMVAAPERSHCAKIGTFVRGARDARNRELSTPCVAWRLQRVGGRSDGVVVEPRTMTDSETAPFRLQLPDDNDRTQPLLPHNIDSSAALVTPTDTRDHMAFVTAVGALGVVQLVRVCFFLSDRNTIHPPFLSIGHRLCGARAGAVLTLLRCDAVDAAAGGDSCCQRGW